MIEGFVMIPPALVIGGIYAALAWRAGTSASHIGVGLFAIGHLSLLVALTMFPLPVEPAVIADGRANDSASNNFVPGASIVGGFVRGMGLDVALQALGNFLAIAPLGLYGPILSRRLRNWAAVLVAGIAVSVAVEVAQLLVSTAIGFTYRVADVDDVLINAAGVMAGYALYRSLVGSSADPGHARAPG
jgi:glycopeptide antibiotics resistance protein